MRQRDFRPEIDSIISVGSLRLNLVAVPLDLGQESLAVLVDAPGKTPPRPFRSNSDTFKLWTRGDGERLRRGGGDTRREVD